MNHENEHPLINLLDFVFLQEKPNMTTMESLKFLASSPYIRDLATLVVAYGISINLVEVTWKSKLKAQVYIFKRFNHKNHQTWNDISQSYQKSIWCFYFSKVF